MTSSFAEYMSQPCDVPGCTHTATYNLYGLGSNETIGPDVKKACDLHAYAAQREGVTIRARNE